MSNQCFSGYSIVGNKKIIEKLHGEFKKVLKKDRSKYNDQRGTYLSNSNWLGWLTIDLLHLDPEVDNVYCRGTVCDFDEDITLCDDDKAYFQLTTVSAWVPMNRLFSIIEEVYGVEVLFIADELGCGLSCTNDIEGRFYTDRYIVDSDIDMDYFEDFERLAAFIEGEAGERPTSFDDISNILEKHGISERISVYKIDFVSLSDFK